MISIWKLNWLSVYKMAFIFTAAPSQLYSCIGQFHVKELFPSPGIDPEFRFLCVGVSGSSTSYNQITLNPQNSPSVSTKKFMDFISLNVVQKNTKNALYISLHISNAYLMNLQLLNVPASWLVTC